ncbi:MAG: 16S rRNA (guanine(527)-N(7))-methyltransferase RsmG [Deltaproteobacteria bacterium]|nr:16S rRNA (guanine(527)-N(7))-methyltransferase RsmG [Deltaproteobacteria bacterium]
MPEIPSVLTDAEWADFQAWCAALTIPVSPALRENLGRYRALLLDWNTRVNLTRVGNPRAVLIKHFLDSLAVLPHLDFEGPLLDVGSGAGLPGLVLKLARPGLPVTLVEARAKKVAFLEEARRRLGVSGLTILHQHLEPADPALGGRFGTVVSRAFTAPAPFLVLARGFLASRGRVIAMMGPPRPGEPDPAQTAREQGAGRAEVVAFSLPEGAGDRRLLVAEWIPAAGST